MILYHGTPISNGMKILEENVIKSNIKRYHYREIDINNTNTTDGYVYLTNDLSIAYYYGNIKTIGNECAQEEKYVYVFEILVDDKKLEADKDQLTILKKDSNITYKDSLYLCCCVRINEDVSVRNMRFLKLPGTTNKIEPERQIEVVRKLSDYARSKSKNPSKNKDQDSIEEEIKLLDEINAEWSWNNI